MSSSRSSTNSSRRQDLFDDNLRSIKLAQSRHREALDYVCDDLEYCDAGADSSDGDDDGCCLSRSSDDSNTDEVMLAMIRRPIHTRVTKTKTKPSSDNVSTSTLNRSTSSKAASQHHQLSQSSGSQPTARRERTSTLAAVPGAYDIVGQTATRRQETGSVSSGMNNSNDGQQRDSFHQSIERFDDDEYFGFENTHNTQDDEYYNQLSRVPEHDEQHNGEQAPLGAICRPSSEIQIHDYYAQRRRRKNRNLAMSLSFVGLLIVSGAVAAIVILLTAGESVKDDRPNHQTTTTTQDTTVVQTNNNNSTTDDSPSSMTETQTIMLKILEQCTLESTFDAQKLLYDQNGGDDENKNRDELEQKLTIILDVLDIPRPQEIYSCQPQTIAVWFLALEQLEQVKSSSSNNVLTLPVQRIKNRHALMILHQKFHGWQWLLGGVSSSCTTMERSSSSSSTNTQEQEELQQQQNVVAPSSDTDGGGTSCWILSPDECQWKGVTCDDTKVTGLELRANKIQGSIPTEISLLTHLQNLDLGGNQLEGSIPTELGLLSNLCALSLRLLYFCCSYYSVHLTIFFIYCCAVPINHIY